VLVGFELLEVCLYFKRQGTSSLALLPIGQSQDTVHWPPQTDRQLVCVWPSAGTAYQRITCSPPPQCVQGLIQSWVNNQLGELTRVMRFLTLINSCVCDFHASCFLPACLIHELTKQQRVEGQQQLCCTFLSYCVLVFNPSRS